MAEGYSVCRYDLTAHGGPSIPVHYRDKFVLSCHLMGEVADILVRDWYDKSKSVCYQIPYGDEEHIASAIFQVLADTMRERGFAWLEL